jgi:hypothetical protein
MSFRAFIQCVHKIRNKFDKTVSINFKKNPKCVSTPLLNHKVSDQEAKGLVPIDLLLNCFPKVSIVEVLDFLMGCESYLRKRRISVSSRRYQPTGKHRHSLR